MDEMRISITVPGEPVAKARPRFTRNGHVYTPKKTAYFETAVKMLAIRAMKSKQPIRGAVSLSVSFFLPIPQSWSLTKKTQAIAGKLRHTKKADLDNLVKSISDGMNGIVFADDAQIDAIYARKRYSTEPRTEITVEAEDDTQGM